MRVVPRVDPGQLRDWESELGLDAAPATAPPLWRVAQHAHFPSDGATSDAATPSAPAARFDASHPRFAPLFRRLEELAATAPDL
jgi:hypothetical protein